VNQEQETRRIIEFCGLDWHEQCLDYKRSGEAILTPSTWQARQPMYSSSKGRCQNYAPWFPEFVSLNEELLTH
jgi:hypothetical protein